MALLYFFLDENEEFQSLLFIKIIGWDEQNISLELGVYPESTGFRCGHDAVRSLCLGCGESLGWKGNGNKETKKVVLTMFWGELFLSFIYSSIQQIHIVCQIVYRY